MAITNTEVYGKGLASLQAFVRYCFVDISDYYYYYYYYYYYFICCQFSAGYLQT